MNSYCDPLETKFHVFIIIHPLFHHRRQCSQRGEKALKDLSHVAFRDYKILINCVIEKKKEEKNKTHEKEKKIAEKYD